MSLTHITHSHSSRCTALEQGAAPLTHTRCALDSRIHGHCRLYPPPTALHLRPDQMHHNTRCPYTFQTMDPLLLAHYTLMPPQAPAAPHTLLLPATPFPRAPRPRLTAATPRAGPGAPATPQQPHAPRTPRTRHHHHPHHRHDPTTVPPSPPLSRPGPPCPSSSPGIPQGTQGHR